MEAISKIRKIGGSLVVTIPKRVVDAETLEKDQLVKIELKKIKTSGFGIIKGAGSFTKEDKFISQLEKNE